MEDQSPAPRTRASRALALALALGGACSEPSADPPIAELPPGPWLVGATFAAVELAPGASGGALERAVDQLRAENVTALIGRSPTSDHWLGDSELDAELRLVRQVADRAHRQGIRVLWSMPTLVTAGADARGPAARFEHPEWLQLPPDPELDTADALLCPVGPARDWLLDRVRRLARSGVDGLVLEAPSFAPLRGDAQLGCPDYRARFKSETGFELPSRAPCDDPEKSPPAACSIVWQDPAWRAFLRHRHATLADLEAALSDAAREARADVLTVIHERAFDTNLATDRGNDPAFAARLPGLYRLWDVTVPSQLEGLRRATADDWIQRIAMLKLARGVDGDRASIASSQAVSEWDASVSLGIALAARSSPWEFRVGAPHAGVGRELRTRWYAWAKRHLPAIQAARSAARVAILQSSSSRDLVDFGYGIGTFTSVVPPRTGAGRRSEGPDLSWFAESPSDGASALETVGELRGMVKALSHLHVPFDVLPAEKATLAELSRYRLVVAPAVVATTDGLVRALRDFAATGGAVLSTGLGAWTLDELGRSRPEVALGDLFGAVGATELPADAVSSSGACTHVEALLGRRYLRYGDELALDHVRSAVERAGASPITTSAPREIWLDLLEEDGGMLLSVINLTGASPAGGASSPRRVRLEVDVPKDVVGISVSSPDPGGGDADVGFVAPEPGRVAFEIDVAEYSLVRLRLGPEPSRRAQGPGAAPTITSLQESSGLAGHSVSIVGAGFGDAGGDVTWGQEPCSVTRWRPDFVSCRIPSGAAPRTAEVVVHTLSATSNGAPFTVVAPSRAPSIVMKQAFDFIKGKMRSPAGGVYTNFQDRVDDAASNEVYPYGHHQTAEHLGLFLWVAAAMQDHAAFEDAYRFLTARMISPRADVVNWAVDKTTGAPMLQRDDASSPLLNSNAPLDDLRVVNGLIAGYEQWNDARYYWTALRVGSALLETSTTPVDALPEYPEGLVAYAYNWPERAGAGATDYEVIPIDYADLWTMKWLSARDARWNGVLDANIRLMERASLPVGHFYNSYLAETMTLSGDFEFRDTIAGQKIKAIQSLWIAIHLARVGRTQAARRALDFYERIYAERGRIAEYLNVDGSECTEPELASTLRQGEARIYAQLARLAYYLGDAAFGDRVVAEKILTDRVTDVASPLFGSIGKSSTEANDAEAWNTLESLLALSLQMGSPVVAHVYR